MFGNSCALEFSGAAQVNCSMSQCARTAKPLSAPTKCASEGSPEDIGCSDAKALVFGIEGGEGLRVGVVGAGVGERGEGEGTLCRAM